MTTNSLITTSRRKNAKKSENLFCFGCDTELAEGHFGIQCAQSHHLCTECSANLVALYIGEPTINLPPRCMICKIEINSSVFERQLLPYQFERYTSAMLCLLWSKDCLADNEELIHCAFCSYAEIRVKSPGAQFMFCKHKDCGKTSCLICLHEVPLLEENYDEDEDEEYEENMDNVDKHFQCSELRDAKKIIETAIENGQKIPCPGCGLAGMKDDACTHMICPQCQITWCYFCGLKEIDCDKNEKTDNSLEPTPSIYRHNEDWSTNPKRCPMYLTSISDVDEEWPDDENECLAYFHRIRSLKNLHQAFQQLGPEIIEKLNERFGIIDACGFEIDDIQRKDLKLIDYENHPDDISMESTNSETGNDMSQEEDDVLSSTTDENEICIID